ncbi:MAG: amino acid adenylation domain-containing protein, partial [Cyclobacteriaceae bacterium]
MYPIDKKDTILQKTPLTFDVSVWELFWGALAGARQHLIEPGAEKDPAILYQSIVEERISVLHFVPGMLNSFLQYLLETGNKPHTLRHIFSSGEALQREHVVNYYKVFDENTSLHNLYGPTEATVDVTYYDCQKDQIPYKIPIGKPIDNTRLYILDSHLKPQGIYLTGELCITGTGLATGYLNRPELTNEKFIRNPFGEGKLYRTGDLARWLPDGNIEFLGRKDDQVKIRGYRIEPGEVEQALLACAEVKNGAIIVKTNKDSGENYLAAFIVLGNNVDLAKTREYLYQVLPEYMVPSEIFELDELPLNASGKTNRKALAGLNPEINRQHEYVAPRNQTERTLVNMWEEVLGISQVGIQDHFTELGGHSLKAIMLTNMIREELGKEVSVGQFFETPTIAGLSLHIEMEAKKAHQPVLLKSVKANDYPVSSAQQRLYAIWESNPTSTAYNMPRVTEIHGKVDEERLRKSYECLFCRHSILRTRFQVINGKIRQSPAEKAFEVEIIDLPNTLFDNEIQCRLLENFIVPFDLNQGPLMRVRLVNMKDKEEKRVSLLLTDKHHIISDGISENILNKEVSQLYAGCNIADLNYQYNDYTFWQQEGAGKQLREEARAWWLAQFREELPDVTGFPADNPVNHQGRQPLFHFRHSLDSHLYHALKKMAKNEGVSLHMLLLSAYYVLIQKYTGNENLVVGGVSAGRPLKELEEIAGMFVNTLALRARPAEDKTFTKFLNEVRGICLEAWANEAFQFDELLDELDIQPEFGLSPLFDVLFVMQNQDQAELKLAGTECIPLNDIPETAKYSVSLNAISDHNSLLLDWRYNGDLYLDESVKYFNENYISLLRGIIENPESLIGDLNFTDIDDKRLTTGNGRGPVQSIPANETIVSLFDQAAEAYASHTAVAMPGQPDLSYERLSYMADQVAGLLNRYNVKPGDTVALMADPSPSLISAILGILKAGAAYLPIDPAYPNERIAFMISDAGASLMLSDRKHCTFPGVNSLDLLSVADEAIPDPSALSAPSPDSPAYIIYTSGSTGKPKGVTILHRQVVNLLRAQKETFAIDHSENILLFSPLVFDASVEQIGLALTSGASLVLADRNILTNQPEFRQLLAEQQVTHLHATPSFLQHVDLPPHHVLRRIVAGGEACPGRLAARFDPLPFFNEYGPTETTVTSSVYRATANDHQQAILPVGRPIANTAFYVLDTRMRLVPVGVPGELYIGGAGVAKGYLNRTELTESHFVNNPFASGKLYRTGDLARWRADGQLLFMGRADEQVKIRGYRIEPAEIETALLTIEGVRQAAVVAVAEQESAVQYLAAWVAGDELPDEQTLLTKLGETLPDYMLPAIIHHAKVLPTLPSGKTDRKALKKMAQTPDELPSEPPQTETEIRLAELWTKVLGKEIIGREDSFFRLGGHSLRAITLVSLIRQHFNKELSVANLHKAQTLAKQALLIEKAHHTSGKTISAADYRDSYPLSAAQTRMYATWELDRQSIAYNMPQSLLLKGNLDSGELEKALKRVVKRHHALHTVFREVDGEVRQVLLPDTEFSLTYHNLSHLDQNSEELVIWFKNFVRPFDLEKGPLLRGQVVQLKPDNDTPVYLLLIDKHHIISDGTSERIITEEISLLMKGVIPEPVSLQYTDYAIWQQETADPATIGAQRAYWLNKFGDGLPETTFPTDYSRPAVQSFKGKSERFRLENTVTESLKKLAADHNTTLYIVVMTLLKSLLFRYTGMSDMVIGSGTANRTRAELQDVVGMFVNMFLLRSYPSGEKTFRQYLKELQKLTLEAFDNQDYQFDSLFNDLKIKRDPSRNPLFDITFFYQEKDQKQISIGDTEIIVLPLAGDHFGIAKFDTTLFAREVGSELHFLWEYCSDLYTEKTVLRFISHFKTLAEAVAETPDKPLGQFDLLSGIEKHTLVYSYNDTILSYDHEHTLVDIIAVKASQQPDLIVFRQGNEVLTYGDLDRKSGRIAGYLIHDAHIREGDPVGLLFHRTTDYLVCLLAAWKARAYFVPLDPAMPEKRLEGMIDDADITCVLSSARHVRLLNRLQWSCRGL